MKELLNTILDFLKPIIASGRTRFVVACISVISEVYIAKYGNQHEPAMYCVAAIAITYIIAKTSYDFYVIKKRPEAIP